MRILQDMKVSLLLRANRKFVNAIRTSSTEAGTTDNDVDLVEIVYQQWQRKILHPDSLIVDSSKTTLRNYDRKTPEWKASSLESVNEEGKAHNHKIKMLHNFNQTIQKEEIHLTPHATGLDGTEDSHEMEGRVYHAFAVPSGWSSTFFPY